MLAKPLDINCNPAEDGVVLLDGMLRDWRGVDGVYVRGVSRVIKGRKHWNNAKDASFEVLCNYSKTTLYLAVDVTDEYFARTRKLRADDHLELRFGRHVLEIYPSDLKKIRGVVRWRRGRRRRKARGIQMAEAKQLQGWSVEIAMPLSKVPGYRKGKEGVPLSVRFIDVDWRGKVDSVVGSGKARLVIAQVTADLTAFLRAMKATRKQIRWRGSADVVGDKGLEQVLLVGSRVGIVGSGLPGGGYFYFGLPVKTPKDVRWVKLLDLNGDRQKEIVIRYTQRGGGGRRDLLAVYRFNSVNKFVRPFAHELTKGQGANMITTRLRFIRWRKRRRHGVEIVIDKPKAKGYTRATYKERQATDVNPIVLPWGETTKRRYRFEGDEYSEQ
ncbi:MAG: hypothetical protein CSA65_01720 [Proteobacteria bacterium]|nr:MAG: hypothetical protein CSA65_01720 [Pseudomonadota bacterium]